MKWNSLQYRLIALLLLVSILPAIAIGYLADSKANRLLENQMIEGKLSQVERVADRFEQYLVDNSAAITALAKNPALREMASPTQLATIKAFQAGIGSFELIFIVDANGIIKNTFPQTDFGGKTDFTDRQWYKDVAAAQKTVISDTYISAFTKQATAPIVTPILDDNNQVLGYVGGNISLSNLASLVKPLSQGETGKGIILDKKGFYLIDSRDEVKGKEHESFQEKDIQQIIQSGKKSVVTIGKQKAKNVVAFTPIGELGWSVLSIQEQSEALTSAKDLHSLIVLLIILSAILTSIIGFIFVGKIIKPILGAVKVAEEIAQGNLNPEIVSYSGQDEIGQLIRAFQAMTKNLRSLVKKASQSSDAVLASSEQLTSSAEQSAQVANQVAVSISEVANGADRQVNAIENTLVTVEQISSDMEQMAVNAHSVGELAGQTAQAAENGGKAVAAAVSQMNYIEETVNHSAQVVAKLGDRSQEIGQIVDAIATIADQTNLLALNAAIEAARAGEQGRGFAVVAEEVRQLAEQSQGAAKHIAQLIGEIQQDTEKAVQAMDQGTKEVNRGTQVVNDAGEAFGRIVTLLEELSSKGKDITDLTQQAAQGSREIVASVREIDAISQDTAGQTQTVSAATQEQLASMEEVASASQSLVEMAQELQNVVNNFRVD